MKNFFGLILDYLNGIESVCLYRDTVFSTFYKTDKFILLFFWNDTWIISGKSCSAWQ
jgi:hypothetical protein